METLLLDYQLKYLVVSFLILCVLFTVYLMFNKTLDLKQKLILLLIAYVFPFVGLTIGILYLIFSKKSIKISHWKGPRKWVFYFVYLPA